MVSVLSKFPILLISVFCLLFLTIANIFFNHDILTATSVTYIVIAIVCSFEYNDFYKKTFSLIISLILFTIFLITNPPLICYFISEVFMIGVLLYYKGYSQKNIMIAIISVAFLLHLFYIQNTPINIRQHDLSGILGYMHMITINGINWKDFIPWDMYYFFHQPLHFIVQGYFFKILSSILTSSIVEKESLQYLSLFYTTSTIYIVFLILKKLEFKEYVLYALCILVAFNPTYTLFSGYISDDVSVLFWGVLSIYNLLNWDKSNSYKDIIFTAITFGLGVLTKLSILLLVPAFCYFFLYKIKKEKNKIVLSQISIFIIIAVPISLIWVIRNHILFDMQFYNIPETSPMGQTFIELSLWERLGNFSMIFNPFIDAPKVSDPNVFLTIIKTELFGEWDLGKLSSQIYGFAMVLYILNILIKLSVMLYSFYCIFKMRKQTKHYLCFFIILYFTIWIYCIHYSVTYPYICSCNYRLFALMNIAEIAILGEMLKKEGTRFNFLIPTIVYAIISCYIYIAIA